MKMTIFKISVNFSENAFIQNPSKISHSVNVRRFIVLLIWYLMKTTCELQCVKLMEDFFFFFFFFFTLLNVLSVYTTYVIKLHGNSFYYQWSGKSLTVHGTGISITWDNDKFSNVILSTLVPILKVGESPQRANLCWTSTTMSRHHYDQVDSLTCCRTLCYRTSRRSSSGWMTDLPLKKKSPNLIRLRLLKNRSPCFNCATKWVGRRRKVCDGNLLVLNIGKGLDLTTFCFVLQRWETPNYPMTSTSIDDGKLIAKASKSIYYKLSKIYLAIFSSPEGNIKQV